MKKLDMMRAIKERGFMAKDIADKLGITTVAMSLRTNAKNPRLDTMVQIAEVIGCDVTDLFYSEEAEEEEEEEEKGLFTNQESDHTKDIPSNAPAYPVHENGLVSENNSQQMTQTSTFCPHCGKKVRVGVVLLPEE